MSIEQRGSSRDFQRFVSSTGTTTLPAPSHRVQPIRLGHRFQKKTFRKRTFCHHCTDMLWGIVNQGYQCLTCNFVTHDRCLPVVAISCTSKEAPPIRERVAHIWSRASVYRKEFCNVCRRRFDDGHAVHCEVCKYFAHESCRDQAVDNCRKCATFMPSSDDSERNPDLLHHWVEGDVAPGEFCVRCFKDCGTSDCLSSVRCSWCGRPAHSGCFKYLDETCDFGALARLIVPPHCVSLSLPDIAAYSHGSKPRHFLQSRVLPKTNDDSLLSHSEDDLDDLSDLLPGFCMLRIFDGSEKTFKTIAVESTASINDVLSTALEKFRIKDHRGGYYLSEKVVESGEERKLGLEFSLDDIKKPKAGDNPPSLYLRTDELEGDRGVLRVYPGMQGFSGRLNFKAVPVSRSTTVEETIRLALKKLKLKDESPKDYSLVQVSLHKGVKEKVLDRDACPWEILTSTKMLSLREVHATRFYLRKDSELTSSCTVNVFVGNFPKHCSEEWYRQKIKDILGDVDKEAHIGLVNPNNGVLFIEFFLPDTAARAVAVLKQTTVEKQQLKVVSLPYYEASALSSKTSPLLVFVNSKSGGGQGQELYFSLRYHLNPHQIFNLSEGGPFPGLMTFRNVPNFRILICGGDGTCGWVLTALDEIRTKLKCRYPPTALLPLGTGNDLARVLRWGSGYSGDESIVSLLLAVEEAETSVMDRWTVIFDSSSPISTIASRIRHVNGRPSPSPPPAVRRRAFEEGRTASALPSISSQDDDDDVVNELPPLTRRRAFTDETSSPKSRTAAAVATRFGETTKKRTASTSAAAVPSKIFIMNNYLGIGIDADITLGFHNAREEAPEKFNSRFHNKGVYVRMSLSKMVSKGNLTDFPRIVRLECDGKEKRLPSDLEGIIILNIGSWGSGADAWGSEKHDGFVPPRINDGLLEIVGVTGVLHLAQIQGKVRSGIRLAQCSHVKIFLSDTLPVQIDGEPWLQESSTVVITRCSEWATMLMRSKRSGISKRYPHQSPVLKRSPRVIRKSVSSSS
ncbi:diacylglycerol kinase theta-like isoform X2 [Oscarella lobularis]|uniref:diacylglycerol kinase theta-like isoform X2 n=1 Tax=Oscarella lobularis TaxID=121494 RepID=UPI003313A55E